MCVYVAREKQTAASCMEHLQTLVMSSKGEGKSSVKAEVDG